jgi:hypothetical protein
MSVLPVTTSVLVVAALGPFFGVGADRSKSPQPFNDKVVLPGMVPPTMKSLGGSWHYGYMLREASLEGGKSNLIVGTALTLRDDGTYLLHYHARWNLAAVPLPDPGAAPTSGSLTGMDGRNVTEVGRFSLSGEMLLLEPTTIEYADLDDNRLVNQQTIKNQNRALVVRLEKARMAVGGRCARYQVDPVCLKTPVVWYSMKAQIGARWLGREPR